jgi:PIN domain nuclease of toxin-antitoxin system
MAYLVDTNVLIWLSAHPQKLGKRAIQILENAKKLYFSPISLAEMEIKVANGKLKTSHDLVNRLIDAGLTELPFNSAHAKSVARYPMLNKHDPADRMLLAQAACEQVAFITADRKLLDLNFNWIIDAQE